MDFDSSDNSDVTFSGKIKTQTFKQFQLERLIKEGKVIPASKLAQAKEQKLQRVREFEAASEDEQRHRTSSTPPAKDKLNNIPLIRERFNEWMGTSAGTREKSRNEKAPVMGLSHCCIWQKAGRLPKLLAETRGFEPPIRVLAPMLP